MAERVVALVPPDYFSYHLKSGYVGFSKHDVDAVLASEDYWSTPAHELGHTYGLHTPNTWKPPGPGEEYQPMQNPIRGNCATGFSVNQQQEISQGICFMGRVPPTGQRTLTFVTACDVGAETSRHVWIDEPDYRALFVKLKPPGDPEILIVTGSISENDNVQLDPWYVARNGVSTARNEGDYSIDLVAHGGQTASSHKFSASFVVEFDFAPVPIHIGTSPFSFSLPVPTTGLYSVRIKHGSNTLTEFDLSTKLLLDAVASIPNRGFVTNPDERRNALKEKLEAFGTMIQHGNLVGAQMKLSDDLEKHLDEWLIDSYRTESPLEFTKGEVLELVNEAISRLSTAL